MSLKNLEVTMKEELIGIIENFEAKLNIHKEEVN